MSEWFVLNLDMIARLGIATVLGYIIGLERKLHGQPAGERTHALVALGAALFVVTGALAFPGADPTRIASTVVSGVGFLGAGVVLKETGHEVRGLTTAAGIWTVGAVGVSVGAGMYGLGIIATAIALFILASERILHLDRRIDERNKRLKAKSKPAEQGDNEPGGSPPG